MKKVIAFTLALCAMLSIVGCGNGTNNESGSSSNFRVAMLTDTGGVNDMSFNQSAWEGILRLKESAGCEVTYLESNQATDYATNFDKLADQASNQEDGAIIAVGYALADATQEAASKNPDLKYILADNAVDGKLSNLTGITFRAQESAFLVGYIAGKTTKTNKVGFVGGIESAVLDQFEYGYSAGVDYASKETGKSIKIYDQYVESFTDAAKGKAVASKMISDGCDVVFHAAGGAGIGVIEAAKEANVYFIGVDMDQYDQGPSNCLTSSLKLVGHAVELVVNKIMNGDDVGGKTLDFGLKEDCVGIPENNPNMDSEVYASAMKVKQDIIDEKIVPPYNKETYNSFKA